MNFSLGAAVINDENFRPTLLGNASATFARLVSNASDVSSTEAHANLTDEERLQDFINKIRSDCFTQLVIYVVLFIIGSLSNLYVLYNLFLPKYKSKMNYLIKHLTIADLMVIFITINIEIFWRITVKWEAGNIGCKIIQTLRAFCLYLSSMMMICISLDRYYAFVHPLSSLYPDQRNFYFLLGSYVISLILSLPQAVIFHVDYHPEMPGFAQCFTQGYFERLWLEKTYNVVTLLGMYFVPLAVIIFCYYYIIKTISTSTTSTLHEAPSLAESEQPSHVELSNGANATPPHLAIPVTKDLTLTPPTANHVTNNTLATVVQTQQQRRAALMARARRKTLKMTIAIVSIFTLCWSPYAFMILWYQIDEDSAARVASHIRWTLFTFAVTSSVINPFVHSRHIFLDLFKGRPQRGSPTHPTNDTTAQSINETQV